MPWPVNQHSERHAVGGVDVEKQGMGRTKQQLDALMHTESVGAESAEEIFDHQFRRRFIELINKTAQSNNRT
jgi:hypothetical protein